MNDELMKTFSTKFFFCDLHLNYILSKILIYMLHRKSLLLTWLIIISHISIVPFFFKTVNQLIKYMYKLTSLINNAWRTTSVKPLSCKEERRDGSWKTYTVTTSVAENKKILKTIFTSDKNKCSVFVSMFFFFSNYQFRCVFINPVGPSETNTA